MAKGQKRSNRERKKPKTADKKKPAELCGSAPEGAAGALNSAAVPVGEAAMTDKPVDLDEHRGMAAQKDTEIRRRLHEVQADRAALSARQDELERFMLATEATTWPEAAAKARYLIQLYAATPDGQDPRRQRLIASAIAELDRLCEP